MGSIVVITPEQDRNEFIAAMGQAQIRFKPFGALTRHFRLPDLSPDKLPLLPGVEVVEPDDISVSGHLDQSFTLARNLTGANWGLLRCIRRDPPWNPLRLDGSLPIDTFYREGPKTGVGVALYSIDTGVRLTHSEFGGRATTIYEGYSSGGVGDDNGHGTGTASCAAGATRGAGRGATIYSIKALNSSNTGTNSILIDCMAQALSHYAARTAPAVVNMSLGFSSATISAGVTDMINAGMVVCASAGNDRADLATINVYPAESDADVIVVGGIGAADTPYFAGTGGTNWGDRIDVLASAQSVDAARNSGDNDYLAVNGTSFAAPLVAGIALCILEGESKLAGRTQVQTVRNYIRDTATTGRLRALGGPDIGFTLPDRIAYLDPAFDGSIFA